MDDDKTLVMMGGIVFLIMLVVGIVVFAYQQGHEEGFGIGYSQGYDLGYAEGFEDGKKYQILATPTISITAKDCSPEDDCGDEGYIQVWKSN